MIWCLLSTVLNSFSPGSWSILEERKTPDQEKDTQQKQRIDRHEVTALRTGDVRGTDHGELKVERRRNECEHDRIFENESGDRPPGPILPLTHTPFPKNSTIDIKPK